MAGENTILSYGKESFSVKAGRIMYGPDILAKQDVGQGGGTHYGGYGAQAFYTRRVLMPNFLVSVKCSTWEEREALVNWCVTYGKFVSNGTGTLNGFMRVIGPRGFDFSGILVSGFDRTNTVQDLVYTLNLMFRGGMPTPGGGIVPLPKISTFVAAKDPVEAQFFYPESQTLKGAPAGDGLYGTPPGTPAGPPTTPPPPHHPIKGGF